MKTILSYFLILFFVISKADSANAQTTVIDYTNWTSATGCNIFGTGPLINGLEHRTVLGTPTYETVNKSIVLQSDKDVNNVTRGTSFRINYNFKKGYKYKITIKAWRYKGEPTSSDIRLRSELVNSSTTTSQCAGPEFNNNYNNGNTQISVYKDINSISDKDYTYDFTTLQSAFSYLLVGAVINSSSTIQTAYIKKITIEETAPELELAPATVATECGIATTRTFAVSNPSGLENITSYEWNLGSANNGWLYNGSPAPQNITTSSNTLNLTSVCNATIVKNVGVTVRVNNVNYKSYTSTVSRTGGDTPVITGSSAICGGSANYSINNLACDATVTWSATGNTTFSGGINTGSSITIENNDEEVITLTANISSACGNFTRTKTVTVGVPYFSSGITTSWDGPGQYVVGINTPVHATIDTPYPNATEYSWYLEPYPDAQTYIDNGWPVPSGDTFGSGTHCILTFDVPGDYTMTVKAHTPCGDTNFIGVGYFAVDTATYDGGYSYRAFPNPATDELVVSLNKDSKSPASFREASITKEPTKVSLINDKGKVLREGFIQPAKTSLTFETRDIPAGNYYLHIIRPDKKITKKQIVIKH